MAEDGQSDEYYNMTILQIGNDLSVFWIGRFTILNATSTKIQKATV